MHEIALPESEWWNELSENEEISKEATELLDGIINHFKNHTPGLTATPELIELAKKIISRWSYSWRKKLRDCCL